MIVWSCTSVCVLNARRALSVFHGSSMFALVYLMNVQIVREKKAMNTFSLDHGCLFSLF